MLNIQRPLPLSHTDALCRAHRRVAACLTRPSLGGVPKRKPAPSCSMLQSSPRFDQRGGHLRCASSREPEDPERPDETAVAILPVQQWVLVAVLLASIALGYYALAAVGGPEALLQDIQDLTNEGGFLAAALFAAAYVLATILLIPASVLTLAAGYIFGPVAGTAIVSVSSTSGAAAAFLISRYIARPWVKQRLTGYPRFGSIDTAISAQGQRIVFLLRLSPLFPFSLLNYALGLTGVGFWEYVGASWLGMLPGTFAYVYLGGAGKAAIDAAGGELDPVKTSLYVVGAAATILATRFIAKAATTALDEASASAEDAPDR